MKKMTIKRDGERNIRVTAELIASAINSDNKAAGAAYSGKTGQWSELNLYKSARGKLICERIDYTRWIGDHTRYSGAVCENEEQVIEFFGTGRLAKELYEKAGIECIDIVD